MSWPSWRSPAAARWWSAQATRARRCASRPRCSAAEARQEARREQHELRGDRPLRALDLLELRRRPDRMEAQLLDTAVAATQLGGHDAVDAVAALLVRAGGAQDQRPARPRSDVVGTLRRRFGQQLELRDRRRPFAVRVAEAVGAGVAAADDHDVLAGGADRLGRRWVARHEAVALL